jgi:hypothetical protein
LKGGCTRFSGVLYLKEYGMIKIIIEEGRTCPRLFCDICGTLIEKAEDGILFFTEEPDYHIEKSSAEYKFACQGLCHDKGETIYGDHGWWPLTWFVAWLVPNSGMTVSDVSQYEKTSQMLF